MGYFQDDSLLHTEIAFKESVLDARPRSYQLWLDSSISLVTFCTILLTALLYVRIHKRYIKMSKAFFYSTANLSAAEAEESLVSTQETILISIILSIFCGIGAYSYWQLRHTFFLPTSPFLIIAIYSTLFGLFFLLRKLMYIFINWIFFTPDETRLWRRSYSYILVTETAMFTPIIALTVFYGLDEKTSIFLVATVFVATRLLLFYKGYKIFFDKMYGFLHLFVYLCTLEAMTMLIMFNVLALLTEDVIVKI